MSAPSRKPPEPGSENAPSPASATLRDLLVRYPALSADEVASLAIALKAAPLLDVGLISGDGALGPKLRRFRAEQPALLRTPWWRYLLFAFAWVLPILLIALLALWR